MIPNKTNFVIGVKCLMILFSEWLEVVEKYQSSLVLYLAIAQVIHFAMIRILIESMSDLSLDNAFLCIVASVKLD